jgi:outer membrane protein
MITTAPHGLGAGGGSFDGLDVGEVWIAESTFTLQYYLPLWGRWRPYAGLGASVAAFHSADISEAAQAVGVYDIRSDVGVGLALQAGVSHHLNRSWVVNFDIKYLDLPIDLRLTNAEDVTMDRLEADLDPLIIGLGAAWRF